MSNNKFNNWASSSTGLFFVVRYLRRGSRIIKLLAAPSASSSLLQYPPSLPVEEECCCLHSFFVILYRTSSTIACYRTIDTDMKLNRHERAVGDSVRYGMVVASVQEASQRASC